MTRTLIAAAVALLAIAAGTTAIRGATMAAKANEPAVVRISARKFEYDPPKVTLKRGVPVILELVSVDRIHGFKLPALGIRTDVLPDQAVRLPFTPERAGRYVFSCDIFCGDGHEDMDGTIVVEE